MGLTLPVSTPYGLALLGLRQGRTVLLDRDGERCSLFLNRIVYQPQAARQGRAPGAPRMAEGRSADIIDLAQMRERAAVPSRRVSQ